MRVADPAASSAPPDGDPASPVARRELLGRLRADGDTAATLLDGAAAPIAALRAGDGVSFAGFDGRMVVVAGIWYPAGADSLLVADTLARIFDVAIGAAAFTAVALDARAGDRGLAVRLAAAHADPAAPRVLASNVQPATALRLPRGPSKWLLVLCDGARFNTAAFDAASFAGERCDVPGLFNVSRFGARADELNPDGAVTDERARFAPLPAGAPIQLGASWQAHSPGRFIVNLPADLPDRFGASFNAARFTSADATGAVIKNLVFEPDTDPDYIASVLRETPAAGAAAASSLVYAAKVDRVPLGWEAQDVPFRQPRTRYLSGGRLDRAAALYLQEPGVPGAIGIFARGHGPWGDQIGVTARYAGPAMFDLTVSYAGARFESARAIAFAGRVLAPGKDPLATRTADVGKPEPVGVVQAKAAGIHAAVTRART